MKNEVDAYIENAPDFARPILAKLRTVFNRAHPGIEESLKWGNPSFGYKGIVGGMGAFKKHVAFGFWKAKEMKDPEGLFGGKGKASPFAIKVSSVKELPPMRVLVAYAKEAVALNEAAPSASKKMAPAKRARVPADLAAELKKRKHAKAKKVFDGFAPSRRNEYIEWITEAKRDTTRAKRLAQALEWLAEGKPRNWKYMKKW